jgi:transposase
VAALRAENGRLREANERLRMLLEDKDAQIAELKTRNAELQERVARLERLISRNSGNSSMPPGADDLPGKKPPERKPRRSGGRRPGKQPGAPGAYLAWNPSPDKTEDVFPEGRCECSRDLAGARDLRVAYSHQVTDLPEARAKTTQYDRHEVECPVAGGMSPAPRRRRPGRREPSPTG